ncbi:MAG: hypothetical protein KIS67_25630 [Verrucomicrobiae bacterium]|nr:hypothetical protein [Verrucomicrobiae bacterium]
MDSSGNTKARYRYDSFGNLLSKSGTLADANLIRFSGRPTPTIEGIMPMGNKRWNRFSASTKTQKFGNRRLGSVGRVTPCAPQSTARWLNGAHGVTRPTTLRNLLVAALVRG